MSWDLYTFNNLLFQYKQFVSHGSQPIFENPAIIFLLNFPIFWDLKSSALRSRADELLVLQQY